MFDVEELSKLDAGYFNIILADDRDVTIQSKNTGHYWYLHCTGYPIIILFLYKCGGGTTEYRRQYLISLFRLHLLVQSVWGRAAEGSVLPLR